MLALNLHGYGLFLFVPESENFICHHVPGALLKPLPEWLKLDFIDMAGLLKPVTPEFENKTEPAKVASYA